MASRLTIAPDIGTAPFKLARTHEISFQSLAIVSSGGVPIWSCDATTELTLRDLFVYSSFLPREHALINNPGAASSRWVLDNCVLIAPTGLAGTTLSQSKIRGCYWFGSLRGIDMQNLLEVEMHDNKWFGVDEQDVKDLEVLGAQSNAMETLAGHNVYEAILSYLLRQTTESIGSQYTAIDLSAALELRVIGNSMGGGDGLRCEILENAVVRDNEFLTTVFGLSSGIAHGLHFQINRIGRRAVEQDQGMACQVGLRITSDARDCTITENRFENVRQGIVFESDTSGEKETIRDFSVKILSGPPTTPDVTKTLLAAADRKTQDFKTKEVLLQSPIFALARSERVVIQGNTFRASTTGIEWSGTKAIVDFRVTGNAFFDCQDAAVQIEPDDNVILLDEPVETRVRLIEKNRFDVYGPAIRCTLAGVRVEGNDIRVRQPTLPLAPWTLVGSLLSDKLYGSSALNQVITDNDVPGFRLMAKNETLAAESNPASINVQEFATAASETILSQYQPLRGDAAADSVLVMKSLADAEANSMLVNVATFDWLRGNVKQEGYAINLSGRRNRVSDNHLYSTNPSIDGGAIIHMLSGEARGNEIAVNRIGLMLNAMAGQTGEHVSIQRNKLTVFGPATSGGTTEPAYALAIPTLRPGNVSISDNYLEGSVMVGAEPFSSLGLKTSEKLRTTNVITHYNALNFDSAKYADSISQAAQPERATWPTIIDDAVVEGQVPQDILPDPHGSRPVVQFADNRVLHGWVAIAQSTGGVFWTAENLKKRASEALVLNLSGNVFDYWARVVGHDLIISGNHSQTPIEYRVGHRVGLVANIPDPQPF